MKAISKRQHQSLMEALQRVENLSQGDEAIADGFITQKQSLLKLYQRYETLLSELENCIRQYEKKHHHLKVNVLAPALRQVKKKRKLGRKKAGELLDNIPAELKAM